MAKKPEEAVSGLIKVCEIRSSGPVACSVSFIIGLFQAQKPKSSPNL